jgi:hypothetical protein
MDKKGQAQFMTLDYTDHKFHMWLECVTAMYIQVIFIFYLFNFILFFYIIRMFICQILNIGTIKQNKGWKQLNQCEEKNSWNNYPKHPIVKFKLHLVFIVS